VVLRFRLLPSTPSSQSCARTLCKAHTSHAGQLGRARVTSTVVYTLPAYNYLYGTIIRHRTGHVPHSEQRCGLDD
jgi:hypothetical protein